MEHVNNSSSAMSRARATAALALSLRKGFAFPGALLETLRLRRRGRGSNNERSMESQRLSARSAAEPPKDAFSRAQKDAFSRSRSLISNSKSQLCESAEHTGSREDISGLSVGKGPLRSRNIQKAA